ncbi:glutathione S-transferase [Burkholderia multivorans]|nr:glutathione S-transferase [Burkholderia multivorans]
MGEFAAGVCAFRVPAGDASRAACAASSVTARRYRGRRCRSYRSVAPKSIGALDSASDRCFSISVRPADLGFEHKAASVSRDFDRCRAVGPGAKARRRPLPTRVRRRALIRRRSVDDLDRLAEPQRLPEPQRPPSARYDGSRRARTRTPLIPAAFAGLHHPRSPIVRNG